jgi:hypothetical protein
VLKVSNLPWGKGGFVVQRYRIAESDVAELENSGKGGALDMTSDLPAPGVELVAIRRED